MDRDQARAQVQLSLPVGYGIEPRDLVGLARDADGRGVDGVAVGELASTEAFSLLGAIAAETRELRLETSVVSVLTRSPALLAMAAATLHDISGGRFVLGLGAGSPVVAAFHGETFERPLARVARWVEDVRAVLGGGSLADYGGFRLRGITTAPVPIFLSAMNEGMVALAGRIADGMVLNFAGPEHVRHLGGIAASARAASGVDAPFEAHAILWVSAGADPERARRRFCLEMAPYLAVPTYRSAAVALSDEDAVDRAAAAWRSGGREAGAAAFPEAIVDALLVTSPPAAAAATVARFAEHGCRGVRFTPVLDDDDRLGSAYAAVAYLGEVVARLDASSVATGRPSVP